MRILDNNKSICQESLTKQHWASQGLPYAVKPSKRYKTNRRKNRQLMREDKQILWAAIPAFRMISGSKAEQQGMT